MEKVLIYSVVFAGGGVFSYAFYANEVAIGKRVIAAWKRGDVFFKNEISAIENEFKKIFHV